MASSDKRQVLYAATQPLGGAAATKSSYSTNKGSRGLVPYFVS
jgi:hypothetical protein